MEPQFPNSSISSPQKSSNSKSKDSPTQKQKPKLPTPQDLISHYESQGMDSQQASIKVIDDLQHMLFRVVSSGRGKKDKLKAETSRKLDNVNARLAIIEMKLDSKPGYPESIAIGVASAATFRGFSAIWPHIAAAASSVWNSVKGSTVLRIRENRVLFQSEFVALFPIKVLYSILAVLSFLEPYNT